MNDESKRAQYKKEPLIYPKKVIYKCEYIGVRLSGKKRYRVDIKKDRKSIHLGTFDIEKEAARKYDEYVVENKLARTLNFPKEHPNYVPQYEIKTTIIEHTNETTVQISINGKHSDNVVLIDKDDYHKVKHGSCSISAGYINISVNGGKHRLHRFLMNETRTNIYIDHVNNNPLDNRKSNLRESTPQLNAQNKRKKKGSTSKYYGVCYDKRNKRWLSTLKNGGKRILQKCCKLEIVAAISRDIFILTDPRLIGCHYKLNFDWKNAKTMDENLVFDHRYKRCPFSEYKEWFYKIKE